MLPTWVGVVMAVSLAIIALAALVVAVATTAAMLRVRELLRALQIYAGPAISDARRLIGTIREEVEGLVTTSRDLRTRLVKAADAAEARLSEVNSLVGVIKDEVESAALALTGTIGAIRRGLGLIDWGRRLLKRGGGGKKR